MPHEQPGDDAPLDRWDPRFAPDALNGRREPARRLVPGHGPLPDPDNPTIRRIRFGLPLVFFAALAVVIAMFSVGLSPGRQYEVVGRESAVVAAVRDRPKRVCLNDNNPCAWLTLVGDRLVAFNTSGPLPQEYGPDGVRWCPSSGWFGANTTGSRFDQAGHVVQGPAPRSLDRYGLDVRAGEVVVDFTKLTTGLQAEQIEQITPADGPDCETIPFDREADLALPGE